MNRAFRFIGENENSGLGWSAGDTIDLFWLDFENNEFKDNKGFILAGATQLAATGVALLTVVLM